VSDFLGRLTHFRMFRQRKRIKPHPRFEALPGLGELRIQKRVDARGMACLGRGCRRHPSPYTLHPLPCTLHTLSRSLSLSLSLSLSHTHTHNTLTHSHTHPLALYANGRSGKQVALVLVFGGVGSGGQAIGCAGFGQIAGSVDDLGEGSCERSSDALSCFAEGSCRRPGGNPGANLKSISHRCYLFEVACVWELTKETIHLPLGCLQGGCVVQCLNGVATERRDVAEHVCLAHAVDARCGMPSFSSSLLLSSLELSDATIYEP